MLVERTKDSLVILCVAKDNPCGEDAIDHFETDITPRQKCQEFSTKSNPYRTLRGKT